MIRSTTCEPTSADRGSTAALDAYADGEFGPGHALEIEAHVRCCPECAERVGFLRALRASLRRARPASPRCPAALRARAAVTIARERARRAADPGARFGRARYVAAACAAAGVALALTASERGRDRSAAQEAGALSSAGVGALLDDLVAQHAQPLPPETTDPEDLQRFDPFVGVPVRTPALGPFDVDFTGARLHAIRDRRAAVLQYTTAEGRRVTVYLYDPRKLPVQDAPELRQRRVRERPVYVGRINGYSVAAAERSGVGYALASDLDDEESTALVLAATQ